jgi:hypothetical protein
MVVKIEENKQDLYTLLKSIEPFSLSLHHDSDGIYSAAILASIFKISKFEIPPFGEYTTDVAVDLGAPETNKDFAGIVIDHHPDHPEDRKYKLFWDTCPTGLVLYNALKEHLPKDKWWLVIGSLCGDGQPELVPDEIWDAYPVLLEERGTLGKGQYGKIYTSGFPMFYFLSSAINAIAKMGFPQQGLEVLLRAETPFDVLDNVEVKDAKEQFRMAEDNIYKTKPSVETIKNRFMIIRIKPNNSSLNIGSTLASSISRENAGKTIIVINETSGKVSLRGVLAKYCANKLNKAGFKAGGHAGYCLNKGSCLYTDNGFKEIQDVKGGDSVMDRHGKLVPVRMLSSRLVNDGEKLYRLYPKYSYPIEVTENHKILTYNFFNQRGQVVSRRRAISRPKYKNSIKYELKSEWKEVKDLNGNEMLVIPKPKLEIKCGVQPTDGMIKLLGWYIAEGHIGNYSISYTLNKNEQLIAEDLEKEAIANFNVSSSNIKPHGENGIRLTIYSKGLIKFLTMAGKGAYNKKIPLEVFNYTNEKINLLIDCIGKGNGSSDNQGSVTYHERKCLSTVSKQLALGTRLLLLKLGILSSFNVHMNKDVVIRGIITQSNYPIIHVSWTTKPQHKKWYETENCYLVPFEMEEMINAKYEVYDITTAGNFDAGIVVHNCGSEVDTDEIEDFVKVFRSM